MRSPDTRAAAPPPRRPPQPRAHRRRAEAPPLLCWVAACNMQIPKVAVRHVRIIGVADPHRPPQRRPECAPQLHRAAQHLKPADMDAPRRAPQRRRLAASGQQPHAGRPGAVEQQREQARQSRSPIGIIGEDKAHRRVVGKGAGEQRGDARPVRATRETASQPWHPRRWAAPPANVAPPASPHARAGAWRWCNRRHIPRPLGWRRRGRR